jgi:hypothetical protein
VPYQPKKPSETARLFRQRACLGLFDETLKVCAHLRAPGVGKPVFESDVRVAVHEPRLWPVTLKSTGRRLHRSNSKVHLLVFLICPASCCADRKTYFVRQLNGPIERQIGYESRMALITDRLEPDRVMGP